MTALPFSAEKEVDITTSARLRYRVHFEKSGTFNGKLYRIPTLNEGKCDDGSEKSCHLAIGIDDNTQIKPLLPRIQEPSVPCIAIFYRGATTKYRIDSAN